MTPEGIIIITLTVASIIFILLIMYISITSGKKIDYSYKHKIFYDSDYEKYEQVVKQQSKRIFQLKLKVGISKIICKIIGGGK